MIKRTFLVVEEVHPPLRSTDMAPEEIQALADATEADAAQRYARRQRFNSLLTDAVRRAEAMSRLEIALQLPLPRH
ncbi:MAG: hypothetical protein E6J20_00565 [Chloroflexi bacterium]|nr:MAG: hypothetical protein E6J20_00565 [Chloroflexota bacterium]